MPDEAASNDGDYDYIVVGSGAGGGPVAANLARAGYSVALLEAGGDDATCDYQVPAFYPKVSEDPVLRWDYIVRHYDDDKQQRRDSKATTIGGNFGVWYPRSGTLGGCTAHNALITICPNASDWDGIAALTGDSSWSASAMSGYFAAIERCYYRREPNFGRPHPGGHGFRGWLPTNIARPELLVLDWKVFRIVLATLLFALGGNLWSGLKTLWAAWRKFHGGPIDFLESFFDPNDRRTPCCEREGVFYVPFATESGRRASVRDLLSVTLQDCADKLTIRTHVLVTRILFEEASTGAQSEPKAVGVEYIEGLHLYCGDPQAKPDDPPPPRRRLRARREIIVAAGTFNTPQLLMLSGVGPRDELQKHAITVVADRPGVGQNLQDRYEIAVVCKTRSDFAITRGSTFRRPNVGELPDPQFSQWLDGRGPYATNGVLVAFTMKSEPALAEPDLFVFCVPGVFKGYYPGYSRDLAKNISYFSWMVLKAHTKNRAGTVTLRSPDPRDVPNIAFHYFDEGSEGAEADLAAVVKAVEAVRELNDRLAGIIDEEVVPGPAFSSRELLKQFVRDEAWGHHASSSARLGKPDDPLAVVDSRFRVIGTRGLRVVDASIFPRIPGFFIATAVYMIAEKASETILADASAIAPMPQAP
jgi:choline dehydrogenase